MDRQGGGGGIEDLWARYRDDATRPDRDQLIVHYSPLVKYVAGRVAVGLPQNVEHADLVRDEAAGGLNQGPGTEGRDAPLAL
mgnify:CR=1 FL=1